MDLIFEWLDIINFKCFSGTHKFVFDNPGLYFIQGNNLVEPELGSNGAGKSTLFDALYWVWSGKTIKDNRPGEAVEPWDKADGPTKVGNKFRWNNRDYYLERTRKPNSLTLNGEQIEQAALAAYLGMSTDNLRRTIIIGQKGDLFLDLPPEAQSRMFTEMLPELELFIRAAELAGKKSGEAAKKAQEKQFKISEIEGSMNAFKEQLDKAKQADKEFIARHRLKLEGAKHQVEISEGAIEDHKKIKPPRIKQSSSRTLIEHISDLRNTHKDVTKKLSSLRDQIVEINTKISQLYRIFDKYNSLQNNICPECEQEVSKEHVVEKINSYEAELQDLAKQRDPLVEDHGELIAILDKLSSKIELQESALRKERHTRDQESELQQRWQSKLSKLEDRLGYDQRDFELIKTQANPYKKQLIQLNEAILKLDQDLILVREDKEEMQWQADTYAFWQQAYKEIRLQLIDQTLLEIEVSANRASEALGLIDWRIEFATERQTKSNTVSRGFSSFIYPPDKAEPIRWESYSGGEEQRWRLAATFALSETLLARAGLATNLEILDEPTIHLSEGGISDLLDYLRDRALDLNRCIYLIDHHILDKGSFDSTICIERTERGSIIKYI